MSRWKGRRVAKMAVDQLKRKLGLPFNQNPSFEQMREHGIEPPSRPAAPPAPPPPVVRQ